MLATGPLFKINLIVEQELDVQKTLTFHYLYWNYLLDKAGTARWTDILNADVTDRSPAGDTSSAG